MGEIQDRYYEHDHWTKEDPMRPSKLDNFDKHFEEMEKQQKTYSRVAIGVVITGVGIAVALTGVVIWSIFKLVTHFAG